MLSMNKFLIEERRGTVTSAAGRVNIPGRHGPHAARVGVPRFGAADAHDCR
jgi:hypothetical protein